ncbi:MAG: helix-hairpin-helix domain-containing protein, partial [Bacillota bacterium]
MDRKQQLVLIVIASVILFTAGYKVAGWYGAKEGSPGGEAMVPSVVYEAGREIVVHVSGAVEKPGVYRFAREARVSDALEKAVPLPGADVQGLNLAAPLKDGQKIVVPEKPVAVPEKQDGSRDAAPVPQSPAAAVKPSGKPARVNINRAGAEELETLPGVGPALAQRIIRHRESRGLFTSEEDIKNVAGIGEKLYE